MTQGGVVLGLVVNLRNTVSVAQSAVSRIVAVVTPASDADEVAAQRTECALKMLLSIPALLSTVNIDLLSMTRPA